FLVGGSSEVLSALVRLVDFCTERWADDAGETPGSYRLAFGDGVTRDYVGDWQVLDWSHARSSSASQLHSALDALERRLWMRINAGEDVSPVLEELLSTSSSAAVLGVLADCAKLRPEL
ncbi:hypothetical protein LXJ59_27710, partial [Escherichia coli]|nr:hypothetical protein [Escherichia coli]